MKNLKIDMLDLACEKYVEILQDAIRRGYTDVGVPLLGHGNCTERYLSEAYRS